jgi:hypothetical protein
MRAKVKSVRRKASKLHGATAGYVSLVDRGANETPFKMIKSAEGAGAMSIKKRKVLEAKSHKKIATGKKADAEAPTTKTVMAKMIFDQGVFESEESVREWLEKAEWDAESVEISDDGDGSFVARPGDTTDDSFSRLAKVDAETDGVEAYVGELIVKEDDEDEDEEEEADDAEDEDTAEDEAEEVEAAADDKSKEAKAEETPAAPVKLSKRAEFIAKAKTSVAKFSGWEAFYSKKTSLSEALKAGMEWDATPPGFYDVQAAFNGVVTAILGDDTEGMDKAEAMSKAAADYADMLVGMDKFFDAFINAGEETVAKAFDATPGAADKIAKWAEGYAQFVAGTSTETKSAPAVVAKAAEPAIDYNALGTTVADLVKKAFDPLAERVEAVAGTVQKMADRRPTKKAADLSDNSNAAPAPTKEQKTAEETEDWLRKKQRKSLVG